MNKHSKNLLNKIGETILYIQNIFSNEYQIEIDKLFEYVDELGRYILELYSFYTDIYLLRRILDKNYVKKCIIYSGGAHSVNFIFFLVKYCNFDIIKVYKSLEKDTNKLVKKIKNSSLSFSVYSLFLEKNRYIQCVSLDSSILEINDIIVF